MALVRMTEKKLAASRANARLSKGPTTPAGKEKVSRNACKHHVYARKFSIPPAWEARIWDVIEPCAATVADPVERACLVEYFVLKLWIIELFAYETRLFNQSIAHHRNFNRGVHDFAVHHPLFLAIESRSHTLSREAEHARRAWELAKRAAARKQTIQQLTENTLVTTKPKTMTMAAGAGLSASGIRASVIDSSRPPHIDNPAYILTPVPPALSRNWVESANRVAARRLIYPLSHSPPTSTLRTHP